jgi:inosine-uridine preferring nucleoside hydrolase
MYDRSSFNRRRFMLVAAGATVLASQLSLVSHAATLHPDAVFKPFAGPRSRVVFVNDLSGDPDGLFAAVHQVLSPSTDLRCIIGTSTGQPGETAEKSASLASDILTLMGRGGHCPVYRGAESRLAALNTPVRSPGTQALIDEAMRASDLPLFVAVGGGLTEVASAILIEPQIASRFTLVWIGGDAAPASGEGEYNFNIDPLAAQFLFNQTALRIWQVTREAYKTCMVSATALQVHVGRYGKIGPWLVDHLSDLSRKSKGRLNTGETWSLGDNPLVLLTALTGWVPSNRQIPLRFENTDSSRFDEVRGPRISANGTVGAGEGDRLIRVYRSVDTRMLFDDFYAKMEANFPH